MTDSSPELATETPEAPASLKQLDPAAHAMVTVAYAVGQHYMVTRTPLPQRLLPPKLTEPRALFVLQGSVPATENNAQLVADYLEQLHPAHPLVGIYEMFTKVDADAAVSFANIIPAEQPTFLGHVKAWLAWNYVNRKQYEEFISEMLHVFLRRRVTPDDIFRTDMAILTMVSAVNETELVEVDGSELKEADNDSSTL